MVTLRACVGSPATHNRAKLKSWRRPQLRSQSYSLTSVSKPLIVSGASIYCTNNFASEIVKTSQDGATRRVSTAIARRREGGACPTLLARFAVERISSESAPGYSRCCRATLAGSVAAHAYGIGAKDIYKRKFSRFHSRVPKHGDAAARLARPRAGLAIDGSISTWVLPATACAAGPSKVASWRCSQTTNVITPVS
jgi:hypothetical protein